MPFRIPKPYYAAHGQDPAQYVMVLEDLQASGCHFTSWRDPNAEDNAQHVIESLGRLHVHFWNDRRIDSELSWLQPAMRDRFGAQLVAMARRQFAAQFPPVFSELCDLFIENWQCINEIWDESDQTLIHGDTHAGNQFVDRGAVGLYDWAMVSRSPGIRDIAIYLGNSVPTELRRSQLNGWLHRYHQILVEAGVNPPSFEQLWQQYRRVVLYSWIAATTTAAVGSKWQPAAGAIAGMTRATDTCADLRTVEAARCCDIRDNGPETTRTKESRSIRACGREL